MNKTIGHRGDWLIVACNALLLCGPVWAQIGGNCGSLDNAYGPYDYTNPVHKRDKLPIVEGAHFSSNVEGLLRGDTGVLPGGDLDYTLRAFPNHHRALYAMAKYQLRYQDKGRAPGTNWGADCYFQRAMEFAPNDYAVYMLYGIFLKWMEKTDDALVQYLKALTLAPNNAEVHYNVGLLYEEIGQYDKAAEHASRAYDLGFPLLGLKNKLRRRGIEIK